MTRFFRPWRRRELDERLEAELLSDDGAGVDDVLEAPRRGLGGPQARVQEARLRRRPVARARPQARHEIDDAKDGDVRGDVADDVPRQGAEGRASAAVPEPELADDVVDGHVPGPARRRALRGPGFDRVLRVAHEGRAGQGDGPRVQGDAPQGRLELDAGPSLGLSVDGPRDVFGLDGEAARRALEDLGGKRGLQCHFNL